jgi:hypothetical protein
MGTLIDRFCPEISAKEYILDISEKKIVIGIHSLSAGPIHYRISWESRGILKRNNFASSIDTKEVIGGQSDAGSSSGGGGIFKIGTSSALSIFLPAQQRLILLFIFRVSFLILAHHYYYWLCSH